ncbi:hypothetical protein [Sagittula sp. S175]|uniref:hypothetical protein n=1 Tax=Sagittula sp. S175 TaxID=3415129 RepID=UPI003C7BD7C4
MSEPETVHPSRVHLDEMKDGGAVLVAEHCHTALYVRAFSDVEEARTEAARMFHRTFPMPEDTGPDF